MVIIKVFIQQNSKLTHMHTGTSTHKMDKHLDKSEDSITLPLGVI